MLQPNVEQRGAQALATEALCAAQALEVRAPPETVPATGAVVKRIRRGVPFMESDRFLAPDLRKAVG